MPESGSEPVTGPVIEPTGAVLITRPAGRADGLLSKLQALGIRAEHYPMLELVPCHHALQTLDTTLSQLPSGSRVIAVSRPAAELACRQLQQLSQPWRHDLVYIAVGPGTAKQWSQGLAHTIQVAEDARSEGVLSLPSLQHVAGSKVLILRGVGGRELLADTLKQRGASVSYSELYRRQLPVGYDNSLVSDWQKLGISTIVVTSGDILHNLLTLTPSEHRAWLTERCLIVISERLQRLAHDQGFHRVLRAAGAGDDALLACIEQVNALNDLNKQHSKK